MDVTRPSYAEFVEKFSWDTLLKRCDWPATERYNLGHEICDRWANDPAKADVPALRFETKDGRQGAFTYRQMKDLSNRVANVLTSLGVQKGDRVAGLLPKTTAILPALIGIWKTGAVYVPLFTAFAGQAVAYRLRHSEASVIITDEANLPKVREGLESEEGLPFLKKIIVVAAEGIQLGEGIINFWDAVNAASGEFEVVQTKLEDVAEIQYTSGSTGQPKGAMLSHKLGLALLPYLLYAMDMREDDVFWGGADPGWAYGLIICLVGPLLVGGCATLIETPFNAELCWQVMERYGVTNFAYAPTAYRALAAAGAELAHKYNIKLRVASSAGEPLNPEVIDWFQRELNVPIYDHYGQTEVLMIVNNYHAFSDPIRPGSMGRPMPGFEVAITDENGQPLPRGSVGQIAVNPHSFAYVFNGYLKEPEKTRMLYAGDYHLTGDVARVDEDGYFWFEGRSDDLINTSGYRVGPFEIESALLEHPAVAEAAVIGVPDKQRGEVIKAYVTLKAGKQGDDKLVEELQQVVKDRVGKHAFPRQVIFTEALPKTPSGKIQRFLLRKESVS
jgi:acetyl-CoA synthetase